MINRLQRQYQQDKKVETFIKLLSAKQRAGKIVLAAWGGSSKGFLHPIHYNFEPFEVLKHMVAYSSLPDYSDRLQIQTDFYERLETILPKCKECKGLGGTAYEGIFSEEEPKECSECTPDIPGFDIEAIMAYPWGHGQDVSKINRFYILYDKDVFFALRDSKEKIRDEILRRTAQEEEALEAFNAAVEDIEEQYADEDYPDIELYPDIEYYVTYIDYDRSYPEDYEYEIDYNSIREDVQSRSIEGEIKKHAILIVDNNGINFSDNTHKRVRRQ